MNLERLMSELDVLMPSSVAIALAVASRAAGDRWDATSRRVVKEAQDCIALQRAGCLPQA
jgi:hypothetical protein